MARTISTPMQTHLESEVTSLATCWELNRLDGVTMYFTDHDQDLVFNGNTYLAATGFTRSALQETSDLAVDNMELAGILDSSVITPQDIRAGKYDYATVSSFLVNHEDPDTYSSIPLRTGFISEAISTADTETFTADFRGLLNSFQQRIGSQYQEECRADLGDDKCKVDLFPDERQDSTAYEVGDLILVEETNTFPDNRRFGGFQFRCTQAGTTAGSVPIYTHDLGVSTVDGTAVFIAETAWTFWVTVDTVIDPRRKFTITVDGEYFGILTDWFKYGAVHFQDGNNTYKAYEVKSFTAGVGIVELFLPTGYDIQVGELLSIYAGCGKGLQDYCHLKFNNVINFRGEPFVPGTDQVTGYPTPKA